MASHKRAKRKAERQDIGRRTQSKDISPWAMGTGYQDSSYFLTLLVLLVFWLAAQLGAPSKPPSRGRFATVRVGKVQFGLVLAFGLL